MAKLDKLDYKILRELQRDCRILQEIADNVGAPVSTIHYRVKRLEKDGVIKGYSAIGVTSRNLRAIPIAHGSDLYA